MAKKIEVHELGVMFHCPGCDSTHSITRDRWGWCGSFEKPTFSPSILVTYPANPEAGEEFKEWRTERKCHSFVTDGRIHFLTDSSHKLAGKTVDLPDWD